MSVGLLLLTHEDLGRSLLRQADQLVGGFGLAAGLVEVMPDDDPGERLVEVKSRMAALDAGDGVLVMTDLYGATPSNIAHALDDRGRHMVVHGLNLAMLVRAHNYASLKLDELADKVVEAGHRSIFRGDPA